MACRRSAVRSRLAPPSANKSFRSPSSRGLGHRPFTAATGVRIPVGTPYPLPWVSPEVHQTPLSRGFLCLPLACPSISIELPQFGGMFRGDSTAAKSSYRHGQSICLGLYPVCRFAAPRTQLSPESWSRPWNERVADDRHRPVTSARNTAWLPLVRPWSPP